MSVAASRLVPSGDAPRRALGWLLVFACAWTVVEVIAAPLLQRLPVMQVVWMRYAVHLVVVAIVWGRRDPGALVRTRAPRLQALRASLMVVMPGSWAAAVASGLPGREVMAVFWLAPLMIIAFAALVGRERPGASAWGLAMLAMPVAAVGSGALRLPAPVDWPLPLAMAASLALYVVLTRSLRTEWIGTNLFWTGAGVFVLLTPAMPFVWQPVAGPDAARMLAVGSIGVVALYALDRMASTAPVGRTAPALAVQPAVQVGLIAALGAVAVPQILGALGGATIFALAWMLASTRRPGRDDASPQSKAVVRRHGESR